MNIKKLSDTESNNSILNEIEDPTPRTFANAPATMKNHKSVEQILNARSFKKKSN